MLVSNSLDPHFNVSNNKTPNKEILYIDFKRYRYWLRSCKTKKFNNCYKDKGHANDTLVSLNTKLFPFLQDNIRKVLANQIDHCHPVAQEKLPIVQEVVASIYGHELPEEIELWQFGAGDSIRLIGIVYSGAHFVILCPLFVDVNHILHPSIKHNQKEIKKNKFQLTIK